MFNNNTPYDNFLNDQLQELLKATEETWGDAVKYKINDSSHKMEQLYGEIIDIQQDYESYKRARNEADADITSYDQIIQTKDLYLSQNQAFYSQEKSNKIELVKSRIKGDEDDIVFEGGGTGSLICPISQALPRDPVVSKNCRHVYDRTAIYDYIKQKTTTRSPSCKCPVAGCTKNICKNDLIEDPEITRAVEEARSKQTQEEWEDLA